MSPFWEEWLPSFMNWCNIHPRIVFSPIYGPFCTFLGLKKSFVTIIALIGSISKWLYFPPWFSPVWAISCLFILFWDWKNPLSQYLHLLVQFRIPIPNFLLWTFSYISQSSGFTILCLYQNKVVYFVFYSSSMISSMEALQVGHGSAILKVSLQFLQYWEW